MARLNAANNAQTKLTAGIAANTVQFYVNNGDILPAAPFVATIYDKESERLEIILVEDRAGNLCSSVTRGYEGTTAQAWDAETTIENRWTAGMYNELNAILNNFTATTDPTTDNDSSEGYSVGSVWVNTTTPRAYTCLNATAGAAVWSAGGGSVLNKYDAMTNPGVGDDSVDGYSVGSTWINITDDKAYVCLDATAGAAIWEKISGLIAHLAETVTKAGSFTRDISLETGDVAITSLGFKPKAIILLAGISGATNASWGFSDGTNHYCLNYLLSGPVFYPRTTMGILVQIDGNNYMAGVIKSFDADGFTLTFTKTGSPTGTATIMWLALSHY